jgi:hypothetical protein
MAADDLYKPYCWYRRHRVTVDPGVALAAIATSDGMTLGNCAAPRTGPRRGRVEALWNMSIGPNNEGGVSNEGQSACGEWTEDNQSERICDNGEEETEGFFSGLSMFG